MGKILNVEFKARSNNLIAIREKLISLGAKNFGVDHQIDYYFNSPCGRLKLRKGTIENSLIFYNRSDALGPRQSQIQLERLGANNQLEKVLTASNGIKVVVDKKRQIFFIDNVKFHLDTVEGLGTFFEIEAIEDGEGRTTHTPESLKKQCDDYLQLFEISEQNFIRLSYSDMILENKIYNEAQCFLQMLEKKTDPFQIDLFQFEIDHLCYRVETIYDYHFHKDIFAKLGELLIESMVGGRLISTYKLRRPIEYKNQKIFLLELPAPKIKNDYSLGFEHVEVVIKVDFNEFIKTYSHIKFDLSSRDKENNPEIRLKLDKQMSVKFHHQSLEQVIFFETSGVNGDLLN